jgi:Zn-finger nucleic acid-binding protein
MKCPNCEQLLLIMERQNVEIDYCPGCRGVWLDRGELDKIIFFAAQQEQPFTNHLQQSNERLEKKQPSVAEKYDQYNNRQHHYGKHSKRKSFLGDLFDFD